MWTRRCCRCRPGVGHAMVTNTYWYLQAVPELMAVAAQRFESCMPELNHG